MLARLCSHCGRTLPDVPHTRGPCDECRRTHEREKSRRRRATSQAVQTRDSQAWQRVRELAKRRDGGGCVRCGASVRLEVHHVVPIEQGGERFTLSNLVTLCRACHEDEERKAKSDSLESADPTHLSARREKHGE